MPKQPSNILLLLLALVVYFIYELKLISISFSYCILCTALLIALYQIVYKPHKEGLSLLSNGNAWILFGIFLIFVIAPISLHLSSDSLPLVFERRDWKSEYPQINLLATMSVLGLSAGNLHKSTRFKNIFSNKKIVNSKDIYAVALIAIIFWLSFYVLWAKSQGGIAAAVLSNRAQFAASGATSSNGYGVDAIYGALGAMSVLIIVSCNSNRFLHKFLIFNYCILLIPSIFSGSRSKFVFYLVVLLIIKVSLGMKIARVHILIGILILPLLLVAPRLYRGDSAGLSVEALSQSYSVKNIVNTLTQEDLAMAPALSILELQRNSGNVPNLYGTSYIGAILKPIPRKLFPTKPIEFDKRLNSLIFPTESKYVGLSFSALSEPLVNFGGFGVILFFYLLGVSNRKYFSLREERSPLKGILIHAWMTGFMFVLIRGNLSVDYQRALFPLGTALLVIKISDFLNSKSNEQSHQRTALE